jgi:Winged helix DNA-binding domain
MIPEGRRNGNRTARVADSEHPMSRTSREALLQSSHAIAEVTRRLQATLNLVPIHSSPAAIEDARLLAIAKDAVRSRRDRDSIFGHELFCDPAWDILLELFIGRLERREISVKSACLASTVPQTTALRYISHLVERGLVGRRPHPSDSRSTYLSLTEESVARMTEYFSGRSPNPDRPGA